MPDVTEEVKELCCCIMRRLKNMVKIEERRSDLRQLFCTNGGVGGLLGRRRRPKSGRGQ